MLLTIRTAQPTANIVSGVRSLLGEMDDAVPIGLITTMEDLIAESVATPRFRTLLLGVFAGVALLLSIVGIYGVVTYTVSERTNEIGLRVALGAPQFRIVRFVVGQGMAVVMIGVAIGLAGALAVTRVLAGFLFGVSTTDLVTYAVVPLLLAAVAFAASYLPARRAARVDPMVALRS